MTREEKCHSSYLFQDIMGNQKQTHSGFSKYFFRHLTVNLCFRFIKSNIWLFLADQMSFFRCWCFFFQTKSENIELVSLHVEWFSAKERAGYTNLDTPSALVNTTLPILDQSLCSHMFTLIWLSCWRKSQVLLNQVLLGDVNSQVFDTVFDVNITDWLINCIL